MVKVGSVSDRKESFLKVIDMLIKMSNDAEILDVKVIVILDV